MANKSSPHGGFVSEGTIISGTLATQDLLRAFADEYARVLPFNGARLASEAREAADAIDANPLAQVANMTGQDIVTELFEALETIASREGLTFGAHDNDGADFGYWQNEEA